VVESTVAAGTLDVRTDKTERLILFVFVALVALCPLAIPPPNWGLRPSAIKWFMIRTCPPALLTLWLIIRVLSGRLSLRCHLLTVLALATLAAQFVSLIGATNAPLAYAEISSRFGLVAAYLLAVNMIVTAARRDRLLWVIAVSGSLAAVYGCRYAPEPRAVNVRARELRSTFPHYGTASYARLGHNATLGAVARDSFFSLRYSVFSSGDDRYSRCGVRLCGGTGHGGNSAHPQPA